MSRYLAYTSPARGHLYPIVGTLLELMERGHEVHVRTLASEVPALRAVGLRAEPIAAEIERITLDDWKGSGPEEGLGLAYATFTARAVHEVPDVTRAIADVDPHGLLIDVTTVGAAAVAEAGPIPWVQTIPLFQHFSFTPGVPRHLAMVPFEIAPPGLDVLNAPRRVVGLEPLTDADSVWRAPLHLYYTAPPFGPAGIGLPPTFRVVGPGIWEPPSEPPSFLAEIEHPLVLVSASSEIQSDAVLVETALAALGADDLEVAVSTAAQDPTQFKAPANAHVGRWLPHGQILGRAAAVVCHGGMGITQKALAAGVPVCVVPFGRDQFEVAEFVVGAGAGTCVLPHELNPESLRAAVREAMGLSAGAERVAEGFARAGGAPAAADAIEAVVPTPARS
jgi:MGT family glycosyltransferase